MQKHVMKLFSQPTADWFSDTFGMPTRVQEEAWAAIAKDKDVLVSAPTGTGKTLSAFLIFIDRLNALAAGGDLKEELYLLYVSPLKSLAGDIRENLRRPLDGIPKKAGQPEIVAAMRTGDTPQKERQRMIKHPPHILITTPESLYLMLTSKGGQEILRTVRAVILDELHAMIDTKRGAHLMLSIARLEKLSGRKLQRIGLSATIEPLELAAEYLSPESAVIAAPPMKKQVKIEIVGTVPFGEKRKDPLWEELAKIVYEQCLSYKSVIAFSEGRRYAEKLAYYVNLLGGEDFARVHHGSLSKEQRMEAEEALRKGKLRLLCATSSMELGIDVGEIDRVLQIGCPRTVSSTMQRLGRAGHNPGKVSVMTMYPRTAPESVYCGITAEIARQGGVEHAAPPAMCLDILAQHLVSMAVGDGYSVDDVMGILCRAYPFRRVTKEDVRAVLRMLAGDYEHSREIPVRPRILYDRIHDRVTGDNYSRMLAVAAGGTIPDKGLYTAKTEDGVKLGELDEEFVYESQIGDRFLLGAFAWRIMRQDKDTVYVAPAQVEGARLPFWKGEIKGRALRTSRAFGRIMRELENCAEDSEESLLKELYRLGLDETAAETASGFLSRQIEATGGLPDDKTVLVEHFTDHTGNCQVMVHALFGRRVNAPLSLLLRHAAGEQSGMNLGCVDDDDGVLLYSYGGEKLPEGLLYQINPDTVKPVLEAVLPLTPVFSMTFRYSAARALMMGMRQNGRQPLWMQRLRSTEMLDSLMGEREHPLMRETRRECLEDLWDIGGVTEVLNEIRSGCITVREVYVDVPSPMSLPFQWKVETEEMYEYSPSTPGIRQAAYEELRQMERMKPSAEELARQQERKKLPENEEQLHSLLMMEGDLTAGELPVPVEWLDNLARREQALYLEPGLWIAMEQREEYERMLAGEAGAEEPGCHIVRRMLYYRGGQTEDEIRERYFLTKPFTKKLLEELQSRESIVKDGEVYYHSRLYDRARNRMVKSLRLQTVTRPPESYASLMAGRIELHAPAEEQLKRAMEQCCDKNLPVRQWESVIFRRRVKNYSETMLDRLLAQGDYFWKMAPDGNLSFHRYDDIDWGAGLPEAAEELEGDELLLYRELKRRGASFLKFLTGIPKEDSAQEVLLKLAAKGLVCADSFVPVRQWQNREKIRKAPVRQRVNARVMALSAGRWDIVRPVREKGREELLLRYFTEAVVLCRETFLKASMGDEFTWREALEILRVWEYTGRVRRGYFIEGLSGAQFIRKDDYEAVTALLQKSDEELIWLNASDPAQIWGKILKQPKEREFMILPGTAVALLGGLPAAVLEKQGKTLRVFGDDAQSRLDIILSGLVRDFREKKLFADQKRLIVKDYPKYAGDSLKKAGFIHEMQDYVLYWP
ncbi:DEAD/DEAH box helicase [[Clostridium] symbiosum]|uniref:DEAD/DEAH box helicase n=1 Tax=Clostridium symbiosum TaxID=1512 RepID=UPI0021091CFD|nr:DEAD/DEAH box helicase [[Clostridium] symbiosum]MCQ4987943.1 DEAD/DEAH box helicase [[Clostridium] symbiosum]